MSGAHGTHLGVPCLHCVIQCLENRQKLPYAAYQRYGGQGHRSKGIVEVNTTETTALRYPAVGWHNPTSVQLTSFIISRHTGTSALC